MAFVHLHNHSSYSILDGKSTPKEIVQTAKRLGQNAIALTDHGVMHGVIEFYNAAKKEGIKPIIGCEVYVAPGSRFDKSGEKFTGEGGKNYYHLVLLAKNQTGYNNIMKLVSLGFEDGYYYKPRVDKEILEKYSEGIIATSACLGGSVPQKLIGDTFLGYVTNDNYQDALEEAIWHRDTFGPENYFIELQNHGIPEQLVVNPKLEEIAREIGVKVIVSNDAHYATKEDAKAHDVMLCIQTKAKLTDTDRFKFDSDNFYIKSEAEMLALFPGKQEYLDNTQLIADMCNVKLGFDGYKLPIVDVPEKFEGNHEGYLREICNSNIPKLFPSGKDWTKEYEERFEHELKVISEMGFIDYFIIVQDYINWAKEQGIAVGPARGSSAGSLVCYLSGITTHIDPVEYGLLFERFLNPERISMPDIDTDFSRERREEVVEYVRNKYGLDKVSNIVAFGTMGARGAIKDVARVYEIPFSVSNDISKMIPKEPNIKLDEAWDRVPALRDLINSDPKYIEIWNMAKQVEGLPRNISVHASGVVICGVPIEEVAPTMTVDGESVVQFDMDIVEEVGLIKMDFLGLRTLDIIDYSSKFINERHNNDFNIDNIPLDDEATFRMLGEGKTGGVFQFESGGMTSYMHQMKPKSILELAVLNAMYRPGPMDYIPTYLRNRQNPAGINYAVDTKEVREILGETAGVITYQEQVQKIFQELAGFTLGRADIVRRAMGRKNEAIMNQEFQYFKEGYHNEEEDVHIPGTRARGIPDAHADEILGQMSEFASYAFNKSHAVAYSFLAYQTAYLRCHYPLEFMAATISSWIGNNEKLSFYIGMASDMGIKLVSPDANISTHLFNPVGKDEIIFALNGVKEVGGKVASSIVREREKGGEFTSFFDFLTRTKKYSIGEKTIEALIKVNALQFTGYNRFSLLAALPDMNNIAKDSHARRLSGQRSIFSLLPDDIVEEISMPAIKHYDNIDDNINRWEKEYMSMYVTNDPLKNFTAYLEDNRIITPDVLVKNFEDKMPNFLPGNYVYLIGVVGSINDFQTKRGDFMAKPTIENKSASVETIIFPKLYNSEQAMFLKTVGTPVLINARINDTEDDELQLIIDKVHLLKEDSYFAENPEMDIYRDIAGAYSDFGLRKMQFQRQAKVSGERQKQVSSTMVKGRLPGVYIRTDLTNIKEIIKIAESNPGRSPLFIVSETHGVLATNANVSRKGGFIDAVLTVVDKKDLDQI